MNANTLSLSLLCSVVLSEQHDRKHDFITLDKHGMFARDSE